MKDFYGCTVILMDSTNALDTEQSDLVIKAYLFDLYAKTYHGRNGEIFICDGWCFVGVFVAGELTFYVFMG